jgi:hypothetical protein
MRAWGHKNGLPGVVRGADYRLSFPAIMMRRAFFWLLVLAAPVGAADADIVWEPAQILDAEQIAESGAFVPLAVPTFFDNFRYPFLQDDESVIFIANDGGAAGLGREGIFQIAKNGEVSKLAEVGDHFSGTGLRLTGVSGLRVDGGRAVFRCGADDGSGGVGMWEDGSLLLLAQTGEASGLDNIGYPGFAGNTVTFYAENEGQGAAIYAVDLAAFPRVPQKLVDTKTTIPGSDGKLFGSFGFQQEAEDGVSVFRGFASGARELLQTTSGSEEALGGVFRQNIRGEAEPEKILDTLAPLPGGPPGATFAELQNAIPRDGTVLVPSWTREHSGFYYVGRDGQRRLVADTKTRIPELFDGTFTGFDKWAANCAPWVIFIGNAGSYRGLFAMHMERNELFLLLDNRTELGGKVVRDVELSSRPKLGDNMVMSMEFTDGSSGVYLLKFGDGWGKGIFRRGEVKAMREEADADGGINSAVAGDTGTADDGGASGGPVSAEILAEGFFHVQCKHCFYVNLPKLMRKSLDEGASFLLPPDASCVREGKAELVEPGLVLPAGGDLGFGFRCALFAEGEEGCSVDGYDIFVEHPAVPGADGRMQTSTTVPMKPCFKNGRAQDYVIHFPDGEQGTVPGRWTVQIRKDGEVLLSRSFTLL